jgi:hypothetical protein
VSKTPEYKKSADLKNFLKIRFFPSFGWNRKRKISSKHTSTGRVGGICKIAKWSFTISNFWAKMAKNWHSWPKNCIFDKKSHFLTIFGEKMSFLLTTPHFRAFGAEVQGGRPPCTFAPNFGQKT